jgi:hypothetical protein
MGSHRPATPHARSACWRLFRPAPTVDGARTFHIPPTTIARTSESTQRVDRDRSLVAIRRPTGAVAASAGAAASATVRGVSPSAQRLKAETREFRITAWVSAVSGEWVDERVRVTNLDVLILYGRLDR